MDIEILAAQIFGSCSAEEVRLLIAMLQDRLHAMEAIDHPYVRSHCLESVRIYANPGAHTDTFIYIYPDHYSEAVA